jgi:hypothetical protein
MYAIARYVPRRDPQAIAAKEVADAVPIGVLLPLVVLTYLQYGSFTEASITAGRWRACRISDDLATQSSGAISRAIGMPSIDRGAKFVGRVAARDSAVLLALEAGYGIEPL